MRCPSCDHDNGSERRFCGECGAALATVCAACGAANGPSEKFCGGCGERLQTAAPAIAVSTPAREPEAASPAGERRHLTVLFCDLVGSTDIASRLDPEEWHRISKAYQEAAAAAVTRFGGHVDKFLGDGLVCFFGVPEAHEDDAERAVRAGLAIVDAVQGINGNAAAPEVHLRVRVGMHTGPAVVAHGGGASKDVFGDTPNIAARVQSVAEPDTVLITTTTQRLVAGLFVVEERGAQQLKGVPQPVVVYRVVQPSGVRSRLDVSTGHHTPFVGRQSELGVLADAWERVVEGMGQTVLVQGEAGIGKSRLCYQMREQIGDQPHTWLECRCSPYTTATPFRPVIELVEQALTFQPADTPADKLGKLQTGLERGGFAGDETVRLLAEWLELPESAGYTPLAINPDVKRRRTLETLAEWNLKLAELQPMVVLVEDLHWCDPSSLELLGRLVAQSATARVLLVGTARPEFANPWPARSNLQTLTLNRLTKRQMREMVAALSAARALPEAVVEQLVARADGIPLFAEELTQAVVEAGRDAAVAEIPVTLQDSLVARLDRLSSAKEVAQRAAVLGREFGYPLLAAVAEMKEAGLRQGLARLVNAEIVFQRGEPPEATYTFKHALVQEAAYESLLKRTRQQLHGRVVDVLRERFPERVAAEPELVARHAELAGRIDEAHRCYQHAGREAQERTAYEESIRHYRHAIALIEMLPDSRERQTREADLQRALSTSICAAWGYTHPGVEVAEQRACALYEQIGDRRGLGWSLSGLASFFMQSGELERANALTPRVLEIAVEILDADLALRGHIDAGWVLTCEGKSTSSLVHCQEALKLYNPERGYLADSGFTISEPGVMVRANAAWNLWLMGLPDQALFTAGEAVALARRKGHPYSLAGSYVYRSIVCWLRRDSLEQREQALEAATLSELHALPFWIGLAKTCHAAARVAAGEPEAAADLLPGLAQSGGTGNRLGAPGLLSIVADAYLTAGQFTEAQGAIETALALAADTGQRFMDAELHRLDGDLLLATGGTADEAAARYHRALAIAREQGARSFELRAATSLARLWRDQGKRAEARDLLAPVYATFTEGFDTRDLQDAKALLEELR